MIPCLNVHPLWVSAIAKWIKEYVSGSHELILEEIAEEGKESFLHHGGQSFEMIPCLNVHPLWVSAIAKWIKEYVNGNNEMVLEEAKS